MSRLQPIVDEFIGTEDPEDTMLEILNVLQDSKVILPETGKYYTFVYLPKTVGI